jgi:hypothetical protein
MSELNSAQVKRSSPHLSEEILIQRAQLIANIDQLLPTNRQCYDQGPVWLVCRLQSNWCAYRALWGFHDIIYSTFLVDGGRLGNLHWCLATNISLPWGLLGWCWDVGNKYDVDGVDKKNYRLIVVCFHRKRLLLKICKKCVVKLCWCVVIFGDVLMTVDVLLPLYWRVGMLTLG